MVLEDWLTFTFTHVRLGEAEYYNENELDEDDVLEWGPRAYCLSCGSLWKVMAKNKPCENCKQKDWKILVCRLTKTSRYVSLPIVWYRPSTWVGRKLVEDTKWEYRVRESQAMDFTIT